MNAHVSFSSANTAPQDLQTAARRALDGAAGRVVLRVTLPGTGEGARLRRRVARALLQEASLTGGGQLVQTTGHELALLGAGAQPAERAARRLVEFGCAEPAITIWALPRQGEELLAWAATATAAAPPSIEAPALTGFEAQLAAITVERVLRGAPIIRTAPATPPRLAARFLWLDAGALAVALGPHGQDPDLLRHAEQAMLQRMAKSLAGLQGDSAAPLFLPIAEQAAHPDHGPGLAPRPGSVAILPTTLAVDPALLAGVASHLQGLGWRSALQLDASTLPLLRHPAAVVDLLLLRWSDQLPAAAASLDVHPARLVLTECRGRALHWGFAYGVSHYAPPAGAQLPPPP